MMCFSSHSIPCRTSERAVVTKGAEASPKPPRNVTSPPERRRCGPPGGSEPMTQCKCVVVVCCSVKACQQGPQDPFRSPPERGVRLSC
jgi:hypothetical protein